MSRFSVFSNSVAPERDHSSRTLRETKHILDVHSCVARAAGSQLDPTSCYRTVFRVETIFRDDSVTWWFVLYCEVLTPDARIVRYRRRLKQEKRR